jgi:lipopolysaccharide/colanic/teichoic acid biosynthesis glycosyltransferase
MSESSVLQIARPKPRDLYVEPKLVTYGAIKRVLDFFGALGFLILFLPVYIGIALLVKFTSKGPMFYKSERIGLGGKPFAFIKFRSMYVDADRRLAELMCDNEKDGPIFKMKNDPRITPVGRILRKYSLDELPQFLHVLKGEMSLVGPRPPLRREVEMYDEYSMRRLSVKPGITCYWQVMGRSNLSFEEWMALDNRYVDEMSFWNDVKLLVKTPLAVLRGQGAY